jgi:MFS family permease
MMAVSCIVMASLPTYAQIGIAASWIVTICRIFQGISSMGEVVGAQIYLTETITRPARFPAVAGMAVADGLGGVAALGVAVFVTSYGMNWRLAFLLGAFIAIISAFARKRLRETPEFLDAKRKWMLEEVHRLNVECDPVGGAAFNATWKERINKKTLTSYFFIGCGKPLGFYLAFFHFIPLLKENFGYNSHDIIKHNFFLALVLCTTYATVAYLSSRIHPLRIQTVKSALGLLLFVLLPFLITAATSPMQLFIIQSMLIIFKLDETPSIPIFYNHFPIYCRFTSATVLFALSRAVILVITSFGLVYLTKYLGYFGIWVVALPIAIAYLCGISHFIGLERKLGVYPNLVRNRL